MKTSAFCCQRLNLRKNDRRICPISNDLIPVDTLGTPPNNPALYPGACGVLARRRS